MTVQKLTFDDKTNLYPFVDRERQICAEDINELKTKFNDNIDENFNRSNTPQLGYKLLADDFDFANIPADYDNSIWEIRKVYDLAAAEVILPENVTLRVIGGKLTNYTSITGNNTRIESGLEQIFDGNGSLAGTWKIDRFYPHWFGAVADGATDDTAPINAVVNFANAAGGGEVYFPSGTYGVSTQGYSAGITMKSGVYLNLAGSKLLGLTNSSSEYRLVFFTGVSNCGILGGEIQGDKEVTGATTGEQGHCVYIIGGCNNIKIQNVKIYDAFGDNIYIGNTSSNINILNCTVTNSRRNNISVVSASQVIIDGCDISSASGTLPEAGIDIEPNVGDAASTDVIITNCNVYGNAGDGIAYPAPPPTALIEHSIISNCHIHDNGGIGIKPSYVKNIDITNCVIWNNGSTGIFDTAAKGSSQNIRGNVIYGNGGDGIAGFIANAVISNNNVHDNVGYGIWWKFGQQVVISGNVILGSGEDGIYMERGYNCSIVGNTVKTSQKHGIHLTGTNVSSITRTRKCIIAGNTIYSPGLLTDNTYCGIYLDEFVNTCAITGNSVIAETSGNLPLHAIFAADVTVFAANNHTTGGAKSGNSELSIGGVAMPSYLQSPNMMSHIYSPRYYLPGLVYITSGSGSPEGALAGYGGSIYLRTDGGKGTTFYIKETTAFTNTGWASPTTNQTVQAFAYTGTPLWDVSLGLNATMLLTAPTTMTMSNLAAGQKGRLVVTNGGDVAFKITFAGYTFKIQNSIRDSANTVTVSGGTTVDIFEWYYDGTTVFISGGLNYN